MALGSLGRGTAGGPQGWSIHRASWEEPPTGAFGCARLCNGLPYLSPLSEFSVVSTLSKFAVKPREADFCIQTCDHQSQEEKLNAQEWQVPFSRLPSVTPAHHSQPLPETQCRRCRSGPGSGRCCRPPGQHSAGCPDRPGSAPVRPAPAWRSGSGSPCGSSSRSWAPLGTGGRSWRPWGQAV